MDPAATPAVHRAPLWSRDDAVDREAAVAWALRRGVVAVGGRLDERPQDAGDAVELVRRQHDDRVADRLERFMAVAPGDFVWTRSDGLGFRLGRITGAWRFDDSASARELDLQHVRPCVWLDAEVPPPDVPADVFATFARGGRNFQRTRSSSAEVSTAQLWGRRRASHPQDAGDDEM